MKNISKLPDNEKGNCSPVRCAALKRLRKEHKKTQREMAELLNVTEKTYRSWENGEYRKDDKTKTTVLVYPQPELDKIIEIAENFHCSVDYVLGRSNCKSVEKDIISKMTGLSENAINSLMLTFALKRKSLINNINLLLCDIWEFPSMEHKTRTFFDSFANYMTFAGTEQKEYSLDQDGIIKEKKPSGFHDGKEYYPSEKVYFSSKQLEQMYIMEMEDIIKELKKEKEKGTV